MQWLHLAQLLSVNVGQPREITWRGKTVYTSVWKVPVQLRNRRLTDARGDFLRDATFVQMAAGLRRREPTAAARSGVGY
jgi:hypothetical protein